MSELQVLTFEERDRLDRESITSICHHCHEEIEAVGPTIPTGQAPIQTLYCLQSQGADQPYLVCAECTLAIHLDEITKATRALAVARKQRQHVIAVIRVLTGESPEPF